MPSNLIESASLTEIWENRPLIHYVNRWNFLFTGLFRKNFDRISALFPDETPTLKETVFHVNDGRLDFMYIVCAGDLQYLVNSSFQLASEGCLDIIPLHNKVAYAPVYLVSKPSKSLELYGILDQSGKPLIDCKYFHICPIVCQSVLQHSLDIGNDLSSWRGFILFFSCYGSDGTDIFAPDGTPVFSAVNVLQTVDEKTHYDYSHFEELLETEVSVLERFYILCSFAPTKSGEPWDYEDMFSEKYYFDIDIRSSYAELRYTGTRESYGNSQVAPSGPTLPRISRILIDSINQTFDSIVVNADSRRRFVEFFTPFTQDDTILKYLDLDGDELSDDWRTDLLNGDMPQLKDGYSLHRKRKLRRRGDIPS